MAGIYCNIVPTAGIYSDIVPMAGIYCDILSMAGIWEMHLLKLAVHMGRPKK